MKPSFKKTLFILPIFFISTLLSFLPASLRATNPRIAIVGAGIAGLTAAYRLNQLGYPAFVYEGSERCGGRIHSAQFPNGQIYERGAELISASDVEIITLVTDLNLTLYQEFPGKNFPGSVPFTEVVEYPDPDTAPQSPRGNRQLNRQCLYTSNELNNDWNVRVNPNTELTIYEQMTFDANTSYPSGNPGVTTPWPIVYPNPGFTAQLDSMTLDDYINSLCSFLRLDGDGSKSKLAQYFKVRMTATNGAEATKQSPLLDFTWEIIKGATGNSYHVTGGNSQVIEAMVQYLGNSAIQTPISLNYRLVKITLRTDLPPIDIHGNFPYELTFETPEGIVTPPPFDHIVLSNPFSTYRQSDNPLYNGYWIDISESGFSDLKKYAIQNLSLGINSKLNIQFKNRFWRDIGNDGFNIATSNPSVSLTTEKLYQLTWEASSGQPGVTGILIDFRGGNHAIPILDSDAITSITQRNNYFKEVVQNYLYQLDFTLPGALSSKNFGFQKGKHNAIVNVNSSNRYYSPWTRGAYPYTSPNQIAGGTGQIVNGVVVPAGAVVSFWGYCGVPEPYTVNQTGNCHFAGDGTTYNQIGFMNAAVISANRVVTEIQNDL